MSFHVCGGCGERAEIFGHGGGRRMAADLSIPFLGEVPLVRGIRESMDAGRPVVSAAPDSPEAQAFVSIAKGVLRELEQRAGIALPTVH
jgi:ATP-binding protein involved in chromosome partitioning